MNKLPSYNAMIDFALADDQVKLSLGEEMLRRAQQDYKTTLESKDWVTALEYNNKGEVVASLSNLVLIMRNDINLQGIAYNLHKGTIALTKPVPWRNNRDLKGSKWSDEDDSSLRVYLDNAYKIWSPPKLNDALLTVVHERAFHPIRDYLRDLPKWDSIPRLEELLINHLGAEDSVYTRAVTRKTLVAAVARVMNPGCKFDQMLVLVGRQGIGKSTIFNRLGGAWFNDSLSMNDARDKTGAEKLQGYWILEIGELAGLRKTEVEMVKSFLSRRHDIFRSAYGRNTGDHPRQCIIVGSTNNDAFLRDTTGNRRFWPITATEVPGERAPWTLSDDTVNQIWAEALAAWKAGEDLFLAGEAQTEAHEQQKLAMESDERLGIIKEFLDKLLPENWEEKDQYDRRSYIHSDELLQASNGTVQRDRVCVSEIWCELFQKEMAAIKRSDIDELHGLMRQIEGWEKYDGNKAGKIKFRLYGPQRAYMRTQKVADGCR